MTKKDIRNFNHFKLFLISDAKLVGKYQLPLLESTEFIPDDVISFNEI